MTLEGPLSREAFLRLAEEVGLDAKSPHMDELFPFVQATLAGLQSLRNLDVAGVEPDMAFVPPRD